VTLLTHGRIRHGMQFQDPARALEPTLYFGPDSGAGRVLRLHAIDHPRNIGVVGLGSDWGGYFFGIDRGIVAQSVEDGPAVSARGDTAIQATGTLKFNAAGTATVPAGSQSVAITPHVDLTVGHPKVFVTVQSAGGTFKRVGISGTQLTLFLTSAAQGNVKLAYFIIS